MKVIKTETEIKQTIESILDKCNSEKDLNKIEEYKNQHSLYKEALLIVQNGIGIKELNSINNENEKKLKILTQRKKVYSLIYKNI